MPSSAQAGASAVMMAVAASASVDRFTSGSLDGRIQGKGKGDEKSSANLAQTITSFANAHSRFAGGQRAHVRCTRVDKRCPGGPETGAALDPLVRVRPAG